ncbi:MAG: antibiotic biosynthesis monooxygenase [Bacilli bacterium]|nr:antibiotic biosynthesis monooxygenase [Bacilli bacterium]
MIITHAGFHVNAEKELLFLEEIRTLITGSRAESGNISYNLMKDTEKEFVYTMVEVWADAAAVDSHNKSDHFTAFVGNASQYLAAPLNVRLYEGKEFIKK